MIMRKFILRACAYCERPFKGPFTDFSPGLYCGECSSERRINAKKAFSNAKFANTDDGAYIVPISHLIRVKKSA
ncbi:hypothetical protein MP213Fo_04510 [Pseudochrobactrum sp. MP213Fo]